MLIVLVFVVENRVIGRKESEGEIVQIPPRCISVDEWIKKMQHIYTMDYY